MSSAAGRQPGQANLAYGVANAGLVMLTRHLAAELGPHLGMPPIRFVPFAATALG